MSEKCSSVFGREQTKRVAYSIIYTNLYNCIRIFFGCGYWNLSFGNYRQ
jgi:hypothetical protein